MKSNNIVDCQFGYHIRIVVRDNSNLAELQLYSSRNGCGAELSKAQLSELIDSLTDARDSL